MIQVISSSKAVETAAAARLLKLRRSELFHGDAGEIQRRAVTALSQVARRVRREIDEDNWASHEVTVNDLRLAALSLDAMLATWSETELWRLIDCEGIRGLQRSSDLVLHIIATNTPLLVWSSVARALLVGAASFVRVPDASEEITYWIGRFRDAMQHAAPDVASLVGYAQWPSGDVEATRQAIGESDAVVVYGSDTTVDDVKSLVPASTCFIGYGHRFSFGLLGVGANFSEAAEGAALDMLIFDQQGCLSPQIIFVIGDFDAAQRFGDDLVAKLDIVRAQFPKRLPAATAQIRQTLMAAQFRAGTRTRCDRELAWSVIVSPDADSLHFSQPGVVTVAPISGYDGLRSWLKRYQLKDRLQGVSWTGAAAERNAAYRDLHAMGASYVCPPGWLQRPPFSWREDNLDLLRSLTRI